MDNYELLQNAYDEKFRSKILNKKGEIESELRNFIKDINSKDSTDIKIFENLESRIKSKDSFCEKIKRKNYINIWDFPQEKNDIQKYISCKLPDLIGFRVNCFFYDDEKIIYNELKKYYEEKHFSTNLKLNFNENTKMLNGHNIYKVSGIYCNTNFEIQIKCSVNNLWGEVEHSRIYKSEHYDPKINTKKAITEGVFKILRSSDYQLKTIFEENYSMTDLIRSLFYQYTYRDIMREENITILSRHYKHFFDIFKDEVHFCNIKKFLSAKLINTKYIKDTVDVETSSFIDSSEFKERYNDFELRIVYKIFLELYKELSYEDFINYLINLVEIAAKDDDDEFSDSNENESVESKKKNLFSVYDDYFSKKE